MSPGKLAVRGLHVVRKRATGSSVSAMNGSATRPSMAPPTWMISPEPACFRITGRNARVTNMGHKIVDRKQHVYIDPRE